MSGNIIKRRFTTKTALAVFHILLRMIEANGLFVCCVVCWQSGQRG